METANLIYHFSALSMGVLLFFMKFTAPNAFGEIILKAVGKIVPLFSILYAGIQIFKYFHLL